MKTTSDIVHVLLWEERATEFTHLVAAVLDEPGWQELARYEARRHYLDQHGLEQCKPYWIDPANLQVAQELTRAGADPVEDYPVEDVPLVGWSLR